MLHSEKHTKFIAWFQMNSSYNVAYPCICILAHIKPFRFAFELEDRVFWDCPDGRLRLDIVDRFWWWEPVHWNLRPKSPIHLYLPEIRVRLFQRSTLFGTIHRKRQFPLLLSPMNSEKLQAFVSKQGCISSQVTMGSIFNCGAEETLIFEDSAEQWARNGGGPVVVDLRDGSVQPLRKIYRTRDGNLRFLPCPTELLQRDFNELYHLSWFETDEFTATVVWGDSNSWTEYKYITGNINARGGWIYYVEQLPFVCKSRSSLIVPIYNVYSYRYPSNATSTLPDLNEYNVCYKN